MNSEVAVVTGGGGGIGAAAARALAEAGIQVVLAVRDIERSAPLVKELTLHNLTVIAVPCDVARPGDAERTVNRVLAEFGRVDILINNAGTMNPIGFVADVDPEAWMQNLAVNLGGAYACARAVLPHFRSRDRGVIINMSSGAAFRALPGWSAYCCAKAGLAMLTRVLSEELSGSKIRVYGLQPGMVKTDRTREALKIAINGVATLDPNTFSDPTEPATAIRWLCVHAPADLAGKEVVITEPALRERMGLSSA